MGPKPRYSIPFSPHSLLVRLTFSYPRPSRQAGKSRARKTYLWWRRIRLGNIWTNRIYTNPCDLMGHTLECWPGWCHCEATFNHLQKIMSIAGAFFGLEETKHPSWQDGQERGSEEPDVVSLSSISGKVVDQIFPEIISRHLKDKKVITISQDGWGNGG